MTTPQTEKKHRLSKSRFVAGLQCHKLLWLRVHEPEADELKPDIVLEDRFDQGRQVGELAHTRFPGGTLIDLPHDHPDRVAATWRAIEAGAPAIYEATFVEGNVFCAIDVLLREGDGWAVIEVKSSSSLKDEHIPDAAVQVWVARKAGLSVRRAEIMHLNTDFRHPDTGELFVREDVTDAIEALQPHVPALIEEQLAMLGGAEPAPAVGEHCWEPRECPFWERCWPRDEHQIWTLYRGYKKDKLALMRQGVRTILDIPATKKLNVIQQRQRRAVETGELIVEPGLTTALKAFEGRLGFLDFETVGRAVPVWNDVGPWRHVVVQFSYHEEKTGGQAARNNSDYTHTAYLAEGPHDPREELALRMLEATRSAERIVMYSSFERTRIRELAEWLPHLAGDLQALEGKLVDLLPAIQQNVYHPQFHGSFSIKKVLNPLCPDLTYNDLAIVDGMVASVEIARLLFVAHKVKDRDKTRADLLAYCERDTWAMVRLLERLRELATPAGPRLVV
jgi:hypothetical protein